MAAEKSWGILGLDKPPRHVFSFTRYLRGEFLLAGELLFRCSRIHLISLLCLLYKSLLKRTLFQVRMVVGFR